MASRWTPRRTHIDPRLAELNDSETTEFVFRREPSLPDETAQLPIASDSVTVTSEYFEGWDAEDQIFQPGLLLGNRYEILEHVHTGGMGHLYKAVDLRLHGEAAAKASVAVKVLRQRLINRPDTRNLLEMEAARARQLSHPNVINVYDFDEHDGQFFLVMEWLDGKSVHDLLQQTQGKRLDQSFAWRVINGAAKALQHAHENGVIHADVNPGNVFICDTQDIKLLDFGVARERKPEGSAEEKSVWATPAYASPDVFDGEAPMLEDDVFSLACVAYRLLAGKKPFGDLTPVEARRLNVRPEAIPGLSTEDWQLLDRALNFERSMRPSSVAEFLHEGTTVIPQVIATPSVAVPAQAPAAAPEPQPTSTEASESSPVPWQWGAVAGAGGVAIVGLLLWALLSSNDTPSPVPPTTTQTNVATPANTSALPVAIDPGAIDATENTVAADDALIDESMPDSGPAAVANSDTTNLDAVAAVEPGGADGVAADVAGEPALTEAASTPPATTAAALSEALPETEASTASEPVTTASAADTAVAESADPETAATSAALAAATAAAVSETPGIDVAGDAATLSGPDSPAAVESAMSDSEPGLTASPADTDPNMDSAVVEDSLETPVAESDAADNAVEAAVIAAGAAVAAVLDAEPAPSGENADVVASGADATDGATVESAPADAALAGAETDAIAIDADSGAAGAPTVAGAAALEEEATVAANSDSAPSNPADVDAPQSGIKTDSVPEKVTTIPVSQLGLERYVEPRYPRAARLREQAGFVDLRFSVYPNGTTGDVETLQSSPPDVFERSAMEAVSRWRFARRDETALTEVRLTFDLNP